MGECCFVYDDGAGGVVLEGVYMSSLLKKLKVNGSGNFKVTHMINRREA